MKIDAFFQKETGQFIFSSEYFEEMSALNNSPLVLMKPFGLTISTDGQRPILLLKDDSGDHSLPVGLNPLEAGVTLSQSNRTNATTPHRFTEQLLAGMDIRISKAVFCEIKAQNQFLFICLENHPKVTMIKVRADEAMSLLLHLDVPLYASHAFIAKSKVLSTEVDQSRKNVLANAHLIIEKNLGYLQ